MLGSICELTLGKFLHCVANAPSLDWRESI